MEDVRKTKFYLINTVNITEVDLYKFLYDKKSLFSKKITLTSPPYNINFGYDLYDDNLSYLDYNRLIKYFWRISNYIESDYIFLNLPSNPMETSIPWLEPTYSTFEDKGREEFDLLNTLAWIKSIAIGDRTHGQFTPITSNKKLNNCFELLFMFSNKQLKNKILLNRKAIGVPYSDKSNLKRFGHTEDLRCAGNTWFIPHETRNSKSEHPCPFPKELPRRCLALTDAGPGTMVFDPFMGGSGRVAECCYDMNCDAFIGFEISDAYIQNTIDRLLSVGVQLDQIKRSLHD